MWNYGRRILRYLKQTMREALIFNGNNRAFDNATEFKLIGYCYNSFAVDKQGSHATFGCCIFTME